MDSPVRARGEEVVAAHASGRSSTTRMRVQPYSAAKSAAQEQTCPEPMAWESPILP